MKTNRSKALEKIKYAESLGFVKCEPYASIGIKKPRWYWNGSYFDFCELPKAGSEWPPSKEN